MNEHKNESFSTAWLHRRQLLSGLGTQFHVLLFPFNLQAKETVGQTSELEVVLVEDNSLDASIISQVVNSSQYQCRLVLKTNAVDTLNHLRKTTDRQIISRTLLLLDLTLPGMTGLELLAEIRRDPKLNILPVSVLTASRNIRDVGVSADLNVISYMTKPNDLKQFKTLTRAFDELLGALFGPDLPTASLKPSISPALIGQSYEGLP